MFKNSHLLRPQFVRIYIEQETSTHIITDNYYAADSIFNINQINS